MSEVFDYAAADTLLGEWFPDQLMHDDPDWWDEMSQTLLERGDRENAIRWLREDKQVLSNLAAKMSGRVER